jgi:hypothetical protein
MVVRNPIDAFILRRLGEKNLQPSPEANRRTLIRRLYFNLLGLPPRPKEVESFVSDPDPKAYEKLVDKLLASPHYGERFARHWLDISHYADTHGFERDKLRPNAWPYRDYVIKAFNTDKPYNLFLQEQIAGDALWPEDKDAIVATGFLAAGPWDFVGQMETKSPVLRRRSRSLDLDDMLTQVMTATTAITINCARCHDHNADAFTSWMAGGGIRGGVSYGATDELGWKAAVNPTYSYDFHATALHLLGLDHKRLIYHKNGVERGITDDQGNVIRELLV